MTTDERRIRLELEVEIEEELRIARTSDPEDELGVSPAMWLFDPTDVEREEVGLTNILGAVEALDSDADPVPTSEAAAVTPVLGGTSLPEPPNRPSGPS